MSVTCDRERRRGWTLEGKGGIYGAIDVCAFTFAGAKDYSVAVTFCDGVAGFEGNAYG